MNTDILAADKDNLVNNIHVSKPTTKFIADAISDTIDTINNDDYRYSVEHSAGQR